MLRVHLLATLALLASTPSLFGCDGPLPSEGSPVADAGSPDEVPKLPWGVRAGGYLQLDLPIATCARWDRPTERRLVLNVLPSGEIWCYGYVGPLATATADERRATLERLQARVAQRCSDPELRTARGTCRLPLVLQADRWVRWDHVRAVLGCVLEVDPPFARLYWSVEHPATLRALRQEAVLTPLAEPAGEAPLPIRLSARRTGASGDTFEVDLHVGQERWTTTHADDPMQDPGASLPFGSGAQQPVTAQTVELDIAEPTDGVTWGHVVALLDRMLTSGVRAVDVLPLGVRLELAEPEDLHRDPFVREDDPVFTPLVVALSIAAALLAVMLTLAPLRGLARRPRA